MVSIEIKKVTNYETSIEVHVNVIDNLSAYISGIYEKNGVEIPVTMLKITNANIKNSRQRLNQSRQCIKTGMNIYRFKQPSRNSRWSATNNLIVVIYDQSDNEIYRYSIKCPPKKKTLYEFQAIQPVDKELTRIDELQLLNEKIILENNKILQLEAELQTHKNSLESAHDKKRKLQQIST